MTKPLARVASNQQVGGRKRRNFSNVPKMEIGVRHIRSINISRIPQNVVCEKHVKSCGA
ncbi:hypothetical protein AGR4B_Lc70154 [Agrobacterium tumefaciens str. CFBP 5621]|nr:hypothetical protein AGR4B_Lc70154 [Agrobacterium tumefaciens str. CFBP 5621]